MNHGEITISNIGGGAAAEKFLEAVGVVVENIRDPNTEATSKREILVKFTFRPEKNRDVGAVGIECTTKLAGGAAYITRAFFGVVDGRPIACEDNPRQTTIEDFISPPENVAEIKTEKSAEFIAKQLKNKREQEA